MIRRDLTVERSQANELDLQGTTFDGLVDLRGLEFQRMDVTAIHGEGVFWLEEAQLRSQWRGWWPVSKYEAPSKVTGDGARNRSSIARSAEQLLLLRERFHRVPSMSGQEDYCAYRLMEASRSLVTRPLQKGLLFMAKWCFGYLILPGRILATMVAAITLFAAIYASLTLASPGRLIEASGEAPVPIGGTSVLSVLGECLYFSSITFVTLSYGIVPVGVARGFAILEAVFGLMLVSLFTVAVARRALRW